MIHLFLFFLPLLCFAENFNVLYSFYVERLSFLDKPHPSTAILYSATPGMGKTTISQALSDHYHAVIISSDMMRQTLKECGIYTDLKPLSENEKILNQFSNYCFDRLFTEHPNHFYILDSSMDRRYADVKYKLDAYGFSSLLIRLEVPREIVEKRLIEREKDPHYYLKNLDRWFQDYNSFDTSVVDIFLDNSELFTSEKLIEELDFALNSQNMEITYYERDSTYYTSRQECFQTAISTCYRSTQFNSSK